MLYARLLLIIGIALGQAAWAAPVELVSKRIEGAVPLNPGAAAWNRAKAITFNLAGQTVTTPMLARATITRISVKSLNSGKEIGFLLTWKDRTQDRFQTMGRFSDAVAVEIPYTPSTDVPFTMGAPGKRVLILHWAAFRQENIDHGYADTAKIYPNYAYDWYPHAKPPYKYPEDWHNQYALNYMGGEKVFRKDTLKTPAREVVAEGFGSSTWKDIQRAEASGRYRAGQWQVVIRRRFVEENTSNPEWGPGKNTYVTFAVWDGADSERGARKALSYGWTPLVIERR